MLVGQPLIPPGSRYQQRAAARLHGWADHFSLKVDCGLGGRSYAAEALLDAMPPSALTSGCWPGHVLHSDWLFPIVIERQRVSDE